METIQRNGRGKLIDFYTFFAMSGQFLYYWTFLAVAYLRGRGVHGAGPPHYLPQKYLSKHLICV